MRTNLDKALRDSHVEGMTEESSDDEIDQMQRRGAIIQPDESKA